MILSTKQKKNFLFVLALFNNPHRKRQHLLNHPPFTVTKECENYQKMQVVVQSFSLL